MRFDLGHINKIVVIHVVLNGDQNAYHYLVLQRKKGEIHFLKRGENFTDLDVLIKEVSNKYPVLLHFTGRGILNRKAILQENYHHSILLNGNMDAFYFSDYIEGKQVFASVMRKDLVDELVSEFMNRKTQIISVSSGPFFSAILLPVIRDHEIQNRQEFTVGSCNLQFEQKGLTSFAKVKEGEEIGPRSVLLGDERIPLALIPCATVGALFFNPDEKVVCPENEEVFSINLEEARQKNIFNRFGMGLMLFFLIILTANYFYLGHLNQVLVDNSVYLSEYEEQLADIADLEDEKKRKEKLLQSSGLLNKNFLSYYLMEIARSAPKTITFDEIILRPLKEEIKAKKKIAFEEHLMLLNGRAKSSYVLSQWIEEIEKSEWLSQVDILSYDYMKNEGVFELEIVVF